MTPLALIMLVAAQRREISKTEKKVTNSKLHSWIRQCKWNKDSELYECKQSFVEIDF